jgi:non-homologous end joining protein Ku
MGTTRKAPAQKTTLSFGLVNVPVALLKTTQEPADQKYDTAGPNGHPLHHEMRLFDRQTGEMIAPTNQGVGVGQTDEEAEYPAPTPDPGPDAPPSSDPLDPDEAQKAFGAAAGLTGSEQRQVLVEAESSVVVPKDEVRRGIREGDGTFLDLTDGLDSIDEATKLDRMGVVKFIDVGQVPRELVQGSHYLLADGPDAGRALRYLYAGMRETRRVAVVKFTKRTKQALGIIVPQGRTGAMLVLELGWPNHVRDAESDDRILAHTQFEPQESALRATCALIEAMSGTAAESLELQRDDRELLRAELLAAAAAGEEFEVPAEPVAEGDVRDVSALLEQSADRRDEFARAA